MGAVHCGCRHEETLSTATAPEVRQVCGKGGELASFSCAAPLVALDFSAISGRLQLRSEGSRSLRSTASSDARE